MQQVWTLQKKSKFKKVSLQREKVMNRLILFSGRPTKSVYQFTYKNRKSFKTEWFVTRASFTSTASPLMIFVVNLMSSGHFIAK